MNKTFKRVLIGTGIVVILLGLVTGGLMWKMKSEMKKMKVIETKEVVHGIYSINDTFVNMFLVKDNDYYVAVDAGNDMKVISDGLKKLNIDPDKVRAVLLTHSDGDHVGALKLFKNATVYLSKEEEQMINGRTARMLSKHNKIDTKIYTLLNDGQTFRIGTINIEGILTSGHTPGSMSYLINDKYLFVGDAFGLKKGKVDKPNDFFTDDMKTAIQSFDKINHLPNVKFIFTAHTGYSSDYKKAINIKLE